MVSPTEKKVLNGKTQPNQRLKLTSRRPENVIAQLEALKNIPRMRNTI
jgi:hypothetical protein